MRKRNLFLFAVSTLLLGFSATLGASGNNTIRSVWLAIDELPQLVDGQLADLPHGHDNIIVTLKNLADLHTHQGVQAQVSQ